MDLRKAIWNLKGLTRKERFTLLREAEIQRQGHGSAERLIKSVNKVARDSMRREHATEMRDGLKDGYIFFLCSWHKNAARDHVDYQGKIYIDRFWRSRILDEGLRAQIEDYIKRHGTVTVQEIMGPPVYMINRPNCGHRMIPVEVGTVLGVDAGTLIKTVKGARSYKKNLTKADIKARLAKIQKIYDKNKIPV